MQAERFRQIRNLFDAALERDQEARSAFLQEACHGDETLLMEVGKLLAAHGEPTAWIDEGVIGESLPRMEGRRVGPYEILRQLGEGGMGSVYMAARADGAFRKLVALKIVRPAAASEQVLRRFQREREILASLDHPNIARILDGGTTEDGLPYLVMDYVEGETIDAYCDHHRLDVSARLKLFRDVCAAVQYAHDHRVIHRDLKPTNILVTKDGVVKLLDFGIAKVAVQEADGPTMLTRSDMLLMTPEYASPEQVTGGSTTPSTDVYSLGVILYELMTGRRPYRLRSRIIHEVVRVICEEPPTRPSAVVMEKEGEDAAQLSADISRVRATSSSVELKRQLRGDIDSILLKALEKESEKRYKSPHDLSEDLRLHLEGLAVKAGRYAFTKTATRIREAHLWWIAAVMWFAAYTLMPFSVRTPGAVADKPSSGVFFAGVIALCFAVAYRLLSVPFGRRLAQRAILNIALVTAAFTLFFEALPRLGTLPMSIYARSALLIAFGIGSLVGAFRILRREHYLGPIVLDLSRRSRAHFFLAAQFSLAAVTAFLTDLPLEFRAAWFFCCGCLAVAAWITMRSRFELRTRGFLTGAKIVLWNRVISYRWEPVGGRYDVMRVNHHAWGFNFPLQLLVLPSAKDQVNAIFERQLAEWPSAQR
jgi:serine/threonine protein kinase